jgi:hypothetical protein
MLKHKGKDYKILRIPQAWNQAMCHGSDTIALLLGRCHGIDHSCAKLSIGLLQRSYAANAFL